MSNDFDKLLAEDNPWHDPLKKEWFKTDGALREVIEAEGLGLFQPPKIKFILARDFFNELFEHPEKYGVLILRGPRRIGKTSTLKYMIKEFIESGKDPKSFIYLSLDKDELFIKDEKRRFLREYIKTIIANYKKDGAILLILDEVTFYEGWARALKNLIDEGVIGPGVGLIATGSYSLDLSSAKRELAGRFGPLSDRFEGDLFFYPRRFIEIAESLMGENFTSFVAKRFGKFGKKIGVIEFLSGMQEEADIVKYNYEGLLREILERYYDGLHDLFENTYVYTGGYPRSFFEAVTSQRKEGKISLSDSRYRDEIYNLLITDSKKFNLFEDILKSLLQKINFPAMQISENYFNLPNMSKEKLSPYIKYLEASGLYDFIPLISNPGQVDIKNLLVTPDKQEVKLVVTDPAAFIATYACSRGINSRILTQMKDIFEKDTKILESLFESVVISHLLRSPMIKKTFSTKNVSYLKYDKKELADVFSWYVNWKNQLILLAVEAKSGGIDLQEIREKAKILKEKFNVQRLIVVSNKKEIDIQKNYIILPIELFLLFF